jgi:hypothetical protein
MIAAAPRPLTRAAASPWVRDAVLLVALTAAVGLVFVVVEAPLYNPTGSIDPWLYTALFTNFGFTYLNFWSTYYAARLPWVVPGVLAHEFFSERVAFVVLHAAFFLCGAVALFVLVRRFLGRLAAFAAYAFLVTNQLYYNAQSWDYIDGAVVTYLLLGFAFGLTRATGALRLAALAAAGFFLAAATGTNLFAATLAAGFPLLYVGANRLRGHLRVVLADAAAFAAGVAVLVLVGGLFARSYGAGFWFLKPQIVAARLIDTSVYRADDYGWILDTPRVIAPVLVLLAGALVLPRVPRREPADRRRWRFAVGLYAYLVFAEGFLVAWHLTGGPVFQYAYGASLMLPAIALGVAAVVFAGTAGVHGSRARAAILVATATAATLPMLVIFVRDSGALVGRTGTAITVAVAAAIILVGLAGAARRSRRLTGIATSVAVVLLTAFGVNFSTAASIDVFYGGLSTQLNGQLYDVGGEFVEFMRENGFQRELPYFWYSLAEGPDLISIQSLYYYGYTQLGLEMPTIDAGFQAREDVYKPRTIVLLCARRACRGGPQALRAHGYRLREDATRRFASGDVAFWARVFHVEARPSS